MCARNTLNVAINLENFYLITVLKTVAIIIIITIIICSSSSSYGGSSNLIQPLLSMTDKITFLFALEKLQQPSNADCFRGQEELYTP